MPGRSGATIERVGLQIQGVAADFRGLVMALVGEYKGMAVKMLAAERNTKLRLDEDGNPVHYENRLTADIGAMLGLNAADIRRAKLDEHACQRFACLDKTECKAVSARCRELFDLEAFLGAFASEINSFSVCSAPTSLAGLFLDWAAKRLSKKHIVFDEDTCTRVEVSRPLVFAVLEDLFLGGPKAGANEVYRGEHLRELFL